MMLLELWLLSLVMSWIIFQFVTVSPRRSPMTDERAYELIYARCQVVDHWSCNSYHYGELRYRRMA
jgi:hypothetical protein